MHGGRCCTAQGQLQSEWSAKRWRWRRAQPAVSVLPTTSLHGLSNLKTLYSLLRLSAPWQSSSWYTCTSRLFGAALPCRVAREQKAHFTDCLRCTQSPTTFSPAGDHTRFYCYFAAVFWEHTVLLCLSCLFAFSSARPRHTLQRASSHYAPPACQEPNRESSTARVQPQFPRIFLSTGDPKSTVTAQADTHVKPYRRQLQI
jgi:hypothetical protein